MVTKIQNIFLNDKVFIVMSENKPITPKEKMLVSVLVRLYSKERLEIELQEIVKNASITSSVVNGVAKLIGITKSDINQISIQYLNYAVENYNSIKNKVFTEKIERVIELRIYASEVEYTKIYNTKMARIPTLEKYSAETANAVYNDFYVYDPDTLDSEYGDSDLESFEPLRDDNEINIYRGSGGNVIN